MNRLIKIVAMVAAALMTINASAQSHIKVDLNGNIRVPQIHKDIEPFVYNLESGSYVFYVITDNKTRLKASTSINLTAAPAAAGTICRFAKDS